MADDNISTGAIKKKKDEKHRRRDPKNWDNVKKSMQDMTDEEKLVFLSEKYNELYLENRTLSNSLVAREKQVAVMQKDNDRDRAELSKAILARGNLESLCRELQKQNKLVKEENIARIKEDEDRRREVANIFTERLNTLTALIAESKDKSNFVKEENKSMNNKLADLLVQFNQREGLLETQAKQIDLQKKLAETQIKKLEMEFEAERKTLISQRKALEIQIEQYEKEIVLFQEKNRSLEAQVDMYKSQYSDFETTMVKSNKVFDTFKEEMSRMNKQLVMLETERNDLRTRWQSSVNSLIVLSEQHMGLADEQFALKKRLTMLQKLCRQLQEDRSAFLKQLKENNIEPKVPVQEKIIGEDKENYEPSKNNKQSALKLKQELSKVKEVARLIEKGGTSQQASVTEGLVSALNADAEKLQKDIEESDKSVGNLLGDQQPKDEKPKKKAKKGEGDHSFKEPKSPPPQSKYYTVSSVGTMTKSEPPKAVAPAGTSAGVKIQTQAQVHHDASPRTAEIGVQSDQPRTPSEDDLDHEEYLEEERFGEENFKEEESEDEDSDRPIKIKRAPAATNLIEAQVPVQLALADSDSGVGIGNIRSPPASDLGSSESEVAVVNDQSTETLAIPEGSQEENALHGIGIDLNQSSVEDVSTSDDAKNKTD